MRKTVFVAMDFDDEFEWRFDKIYKPVIEEPKYEIQHEAIRVDRSKKGESLHTQIIDDIAHCAVFVGDVSIVGRYKTAAGTEKPARNANVTYEVGLALACRQPSEVLLVRSDSDRSFLFDVNMIPHEKLTFDKMKIEEDRQILAQAITARLQEQDFVKDARIRIAVAGLTVEEIRNLQKLVRRETVLAQRDASASLFGVTSRLLDKQLIEMRGQFEDGTIGFGGTQFGWSVIERALKELPRLTEEPASIDTGVAKSAVRPNTNG